MIRLSIQEQEIFHARNKIRAVIWLYRLYRLFSLESLERRLDFHIVTTIFNYTLDTREVVVIVEEEVMRVEGTMPSPSHFATLKLDGLRER